MISAAVLLWLALLNGTDIIMPASSTAPVENKFENPEQDAAKAAAMGDFSIRAVYAYAIDVPGINGDYEILRRKYKISIMECTPKLRHGNKGQFSEGESDVHRQTTQTTYF